MSTPRAYAGAVLTDAGRLLGGILQIVVLEPLTCRLWGHKPITLANPEPLTLCLRCGVPCGD